MGWLISTLVKITVLRSTNNLVWISGLRLLNHHLHVVKSNPSIQSLSSIMLLIINPSTSKNIISAVFETLTQCLHQLPQQEQTLENQFQYQNHYLKLLFESLSVILTIAEHDGNLVSAIIEYDENVIIELCFDSSVSVRYWILKNMFRFGIRDEILVGVLLEFINDPYPYVRNIALNGLVRLSKSVVEFKNGGLTAEGYDRAVDLFVDRNDCVRAAAIRVVCEWGQMLPDSSIEVGEQDWFDSVFVQIMLELLCSMVRDMSMEVRNEAFVSVGKIKMVSEDILLQTLSKKVLGYLKERKFPGKSNTKILDLPASNAAGAFVHGLEDEFYEVRRSACNSLGMLISFSVRFANDALNLLMDMLNDHSMVVRLQTLEIMYHMTTCDRLKLGVLLTLGYHYIGARGDINVWNPQVENPDDEYTSGQIWVLNGDHFAETAEAGWIVYPRIYGDTTTRFFVYWTVSKLGAGRVQLSLQKKWDFLYFAIGVGKITFDKASVHYYVQSHIQINEYRDRVVLPNVTKKFGRHIGTCVKVLDMTSLKLSAVSQIKLLTVISTIDDLNYPEKTDTYYVVNVPYIFSACWKRKRKKIQVLQDCGRDELLKIINLESIPHFCRKEGSGSSRHSSNGNDDCF
ncbi:hypothetical protein MKX01_020900 [Papaver californicum]|nr:hypothetical protein MKX01_020900 [Papaver californicum]